LLIPFLREAFKIRALLISKTREKVFRKHSKKPLASAALYLMGLTPARKENKLCVKNFSAQLLVALELTVMTLTFSRVATAMDIDDDPYHALPSNGSRFHTGLVEVRSAAMRSIAADLGRNWEKEGGAAIERAWYVQTGRTDQYTDPVGRLVCACCETMQFGQVRESFYQYALKPTMQSLCIDPYGPKGAYRWKILR